LEQLLAAQGRRKDWLASQAGVSPSLISHVLAGRRTIAVEVAERMAAALQVPVFVAFDRSTGPINRTDRQSEDAA
jgi:transcriptional regulator with XRE-family HTH domain